MAEFNSKVGMNPESVDPQISPKPRKGKGGSLIGALSYSAALALGACTADEEKLETESKPGVFIVIEDDTNSEGSRPNFVSLMSEYPSLRVGGSTTAASTTPSISDAFCGNLQDAPGSPLQTGRYDNREGQASEQDGTAPEYPHDCSLGLDGLSAAGGKVAYETGNNTFYKRDLPGFEQGVEIAARCLIPEAEDCPLEDLTSGADELKLNAQAWLDAGAEGLYVMHSFGNHPGPDSGYDTVSGEKEREGNDVLTQAHEARLDCVDKYPSPDSFGDANYAAGVGTSGANSMDDLARALTDSEDIAAAQAQVECVNQVGYPVLDGNTVSSDGDPMGLLRNALEKGVPVLIMNDHGEQMPGPWGENGAMSTVVGHPEEPEVQDGQLRVNGFDLRIILPQGSEAQFYASAASNTQIMPIALGFLGIDPVEFYDDPAAANPLDPNYVDQRTFLNGAPMQVDGHSIYTTYFCMGGEQIVAAYVPTIGYAYATKFNGAAAVSSDKTRYYTSEGTSATGGETFAGPFSEAEDGTLEQAMQASMDAATALECETI